MKRSVLRQINKTGKRVDGAGLGEDCAVFPFPESGSVAVCVQEAAVLMNAAGRETSADAVAGIGQLIQRCANNLAAGGAGMKEIRMALVLPETVEEVYAQIEAQVRRFYENEVEAKPGVKKLLSLLKMEGVWMYVATATDRHLAEEALRHAGIRDYFRGLVTSAETGVGKDVSPEIYQRAMRRLRSNKKDTVIFEDALHAIRTAKAAGFRVAAIYDPSAEDDQEEIRKLADYYFRSFEELFEAKSLE